MSPTISKANQAQGMLLFTLNMQKQRFAIGTLKVREIVPFLPTTQIPYSHQHVVGTVSIRGLTVPVIDMAAAIGFRPITPEEYSSTYLVVTDCLRTVVAFMVREIDKIIECNWREIEPAPDSSGKNIFVTGVTKFNGDIVQLLDVELLLSKIYPQYADTKIPMLTDVQRERMKALNVLLVDDSSIARKQLGDALNQINIPFNICKDGNSALAFMRDQANRSNAVDILVSDIEMPGLDGYELVFEVQNDSSLNQAYRILHTSLSSEMCTDRARQVGAHEALMKFNAGELIEAMLRGAETFSEH
ncbi:chemotaxis protein CheW [Vibrio sp. 10N.286.49.C2]|uniref:chemotaxis protein n=1 Tax=unclassified Vibrio TaxID=2614977 RepID=UPI000C8279B8|nr:MULTISPECIES: chemotaxis protein [unclassified Vibrio]PMH43322.1 chemotaxis protein CheW [Vibrio sp. 10N.286.49.C2]PMH56974.1 chemotaxis protein CheW [Vibrio sp. 10N.286.49.B1]PMH79110.1 chemotaxis protein CheW [Vibrio sp. 10N.286.48.B7]